MAFQKSAQSLGARLHVGARTPLIAGVSAVAALVLAAAGFAWAQGGGGGFSLEKADASEVSQPAEAASAGGEAQAAGQGGGEEGAGTEAAGNGVCVHVSGAVAAPGVYRLPSGARVADAVQAAGGFSEGAASDALNLARLLNDGEQVAVRKTAETTPDQVIHDMIGRDASSFYKREYFPIGNRVLRAEHYENKNTVHDVSFEVRSGEVFGLGGLVGAGRTELARMIYGADHKRSGRLYVDEKEITPTDPKDAISKGIFMISEDRKGEGLLNLRSVKENIMVTHNESHEFINLKKESEEVEKSIRAFEIKVPSQDAEVTSLSGGNQQKTIIARCVMDPGEIYIFDEPTKGVDVGAKEEIYQHILNLAKADKFVIIISSDMPELLSMSDRIGVMHEGKLTHILDAKKTTEDDLMKKYLGY